MTRSNMISHVDLVVINDGIRWGKFGPWVWEGGTYFEESDGSSLFRSGIVDNRFMMGLNPMRLSLEGLNYMLYL